jgi:hypothetical protein
LTVAFHSDRERHLQCLGGKIKLSRAYYHCRSCGKGSFPFDQAAKLPSRTITPALEELTAYCGCVSDSFQRGSELLHKTADIILSESTVERVTEDAGERLAEQLKNNQPVGKQRPLDWNHDATGSTVAYIGIDAVSVPQQGPDGGKADHRMAYLGTIFNALPDIERVFENLPNPGAQMQVRYSCGIMPLAAMGPLMRLEAYQVGLDYAETWIAISDGGAGLEYFLESNFPRVDAVILDFYHASEYLSKLSKSIHGNNEEASRLQTESWCKVLREEGGDMMLSILQSESDQMRAKCGEVYEDVLRYFENHRHRMEYPEYEAKGWYIGSGVVESGCKTVVSARLKGPGMRWSEAGGNGMCYLRALLCSSQSLWDTFWQGVMAA